jgi:hypothetical protein
MVPRLESDAVTLRFEAMETTQRRRRTGEAARVQSASSSNTNIFVLIMIVNQPVPVLHGQSDNCPCSP